ncbi:PASTA domain-containing protein [Bifidobacterium sp. ESL0790]|uniref:protein kinase domain-containing protein n=1 Tax=Bifidobacterium sp. ESL0790 TaxID=2983233 RepID=UPI0023F7EA95|nr:PASTA domain-containing protein [Bifidobacterium sp. ESL0790]WEV72939.1 PASTA domain-containing protein [Bifidobacterium sp. ESL0790]
MSQTDQAPTIEGRYRVLAKIADGGMATVYKALDLRLDRTVAIKVMHTQLAQGPHRDQFVERFHREARSAAAISNPHIVQVYDTGTWQNLDFLVMEYVHGVNLRHEMEERGALSVRETVRIISQTLDGLSSAHQAGVVHRDIKPENILLNDRGRVQITDFGLAKAVSQATLSTTGMLLGTAAYLAPEIIERNEATPQGDLYSVGIMAWEMLAGEVPFASGNPVTMVFKHVHEDVPAISTVCPGISPAIDGFITELTRREISARPTDATAALRELKALSSRLDVKAWSYRRPANGSDDAADGSQVDSQHPFGALIDARDENNAAANPPGDDIDVTADNRGYQAESQNDGNTSDIDNAGTLNPSNTNDTNASNATNATNGNGQPGNPYPWMTQAPAPPRPASSSASTSIFTPLESDTAQSQQTPTATSQPTTVQYQRSGLSAAAPNAATQSINGRTLANDGSKAVNDPTIAIGLMDAPQPDDDMNGGNVANAGEIALPASPSGTKPAKRNHRKAITIAIIAGLLVLAAAGGAWWYFLGPGSYWSVPKPDQLSCPEKTACKITDVRWSPYESTLKVAGVPYEVEQSYSDTVKRGDIISTNPGTVGSHVSKRRDAKLKVVVSRGIRQVTVPKDILDPQTVDGKKPIATLKKAGFINIAHDETKDEYSETLPQGAATSITPKPGTTVPHNRKVTVVLSKGPMPVSMPDITGRSKAEAQTALDDAKLKANYTEQFSDSVKAGNIISQSVKANTQLHWGDSVDVVVSKGPETVTIPDVRGKSSSDAQKTLEALGLKVKISAPLGDVWHEVRLQSPDPGQQVPVRDGNGNPTVITLTVV